MKEFPAFYSGMYTPTPVVKKTVVAQSTHTVFTSVDVFLRM